MIKMGSFRSYVDLEEYEMKIPAPANGSFLQPKLIPGELVIAEATNVLKFTSLTKTKGLSGSLFVTNARVVFVSSDHVCSEDSFPLLSINTLWYYESSSKVSSSSTGSSGKKTRRRVKLGPMRSPSSSFQGSSSLGQPPSNLHSNLIPSSGSTRIHEIFLVCSNFRTVRISFKFSPIDQGLRICNAIIHHSFPDQLERLFYFDFCKVYNAQWTSALGGGALAGNPAGSGMASLASSRSLLTIPSYMDKGDWLKELNVTRTAAGGYRISGINEGFQLCGSLPEWLVVPSDVNDARVMNIAEKLKGSRPPHWTWGDPRGAAILIMGKLNNEADSSAENSFFESLRKVHPKGLAPTIHDLDTVVSLKEIRQSFVALVELCCPESFSQYQETDSKFYSMLDHTKWLLLLSKVLAKCREIVDDLNEQGNAIILQEHEGRDVSCLFGSLVQLILDSRYRTVTGFFSLIQKDWVAFGHSFHLTHMHTSPVFLLFLDSVSQLLAQNPLDFEFNDRLLSSLWDSNFDCTTGTFLFDSPQQRKSNELCKDSTAWISIFSSANTESGDSPLDNGTTPSRGGTAPSPRRDVLFPKTVVPKALINPFYVVNSLLNTVSLDHSSPAGLFKSQPQLPLYHASTPGVNPNNTQVLSSCSSQMCDIVFWETLYMNRTLETTPMIVTSGEGLVTSAPLVQQKHGVSPASPTHSSPASPSPSPSSKFYFPLPPTGGDSNQQRRRPGRDTVTELRVIEDLLASHSATTRFQRNLPFNTSPSQASSVGGVGPGPGFLQPKRTGPLPQHHHRHVLPTSSVVTHRSPRGHFSPAQLAAASSGAVPMTHRFTEGNSGATRSGSPRRNPFVNMTRT